MGKFKFIKRHFIIMTWILSFFPFLMTLIANTVTLNFASSLRFITGGELILSCFIVLASSLINILRLETTKDFKERAIVLEYSIIVILLFVFVAYNEIRTSSEVVYLMTYILSLVSVFLALLFSFLAEKLIQEVRND